ncbi:hypothetical protein [Streptomyces sp. NPDC057002]|uniref:hypothetical protein n=1 Tax=Streptomyces sp. NPDC057002 TaxID=3345992 RepID=UPI003634127A
MEDVVFKRLGGVYEPSVRGWRKYKVRGTTKAIVGTGTGSLASPRCLLRGRYDDRGRMQHTGRTTLAQATGSTAAGGRRCPSRWCGPS